MIAVRKMSPADADVVLRIYQEGIDTRLATFETSAPDWQEWDSSHLETCRLVAFEDGEVLGWAALSAVSDRCVYEGVAEVSVYISTTARGKGVGSLLLSALVTASEEEGIWTLHAGMFPENKASVALHTKHGFRILGRRERIGQLDGEWRDTLVLERRSKVVGIDENEQS